MEVREVVRIRDKGVSKEFIFWCVFVIYCLLSAGFSWQWNLLPHTVKHPTLILCAFLGVCYIRDKNFTSTLSELNERFVNTDIAIWVMVVLYCVLFICFKLCQHYSFRTTTCDLSMYDYALHNTFHGNFMYTPVLGRSYFSEHLAPILLLLVPFYKFFSGEVFLLVLECFFVAGAAVPLYYLMSITSRDKVLSLLVCLLYLNSRYMLLGLEFDFHHEMLFPFMLFSCFYFFYKKKNVHFFAFLLLSLSIKEDIGLYMFFVGLYFASFGKRRKIGLATSIISITWLIVALKVIMPLFSGAYASHFINDRYSLGSGYVEMLKNIVLNPMIIVNGLFHPSTLKVLSEFVWLPLLDPLSLVAIPPLLLNTLSTYSMQNTLSVYYSITLLPYICIAVGNSIRKISRKIPSQKIVFFLAILLLREHYNLVPRVRFHFPDKHDFYGLQLLKTISQDASYSAQTILIPHIKKRDNVFLFPRQYKTVEYIFLDTERFIWPVRTKEEYDGLVTELRNSESFSLIHDKNGFLLFKNKNYKLAPDI